jgi:hypothetical protein
MRRSVRLLLPVLLAIASPLWMAASAQSRPVKKTPPVDVTGKWFMVVKFGDTGGFRATITFKQRGEKLDGHYSHPGFAEVDFPATIKGKSLAFSFSFPNPSHEGVTDTITATGTVEDDNTIKGRLKATSKGPGTDAGGEGLLSRRPRGDGAGRDRHRPRPCRRCRPDAVPRLDVVWPHATGSQDLCCRRDPFCVRCHPCGVRSGATRDESRSADCATR